MNSGPFAREGGSNAGLLWFINSACFDPPNNIELKE
jgi:hypothetical protein